MTSLIEFHDPLSKRTVTLVIGDTTGVRHEGIQWKAGGEVLTGCDKLAAVSPELDSAFCPNCHWQCRISGAWFVDVLRVVVGVRSCSVCGCTDDEACDGGCAWVADDLCSACIDEGL